MNSKKSLKTVLLSLAVIAAVPTKTTCAETGNPLQAAITCARNHPVALSATILGLYVMHRRLVTKPTAKVPYSMEDLREDFKEFLSSLNIFDAKMYKQLLHMFDKYIIGLQVKIEETTTRTKNEDGSVFSLKGKKLIQKPFGAYGLFHAYVLTDMDKFLAYIPTLATMYLLLNNPEKSIDNALAKAASAGK